MGDSNKDSNRLKYFYAATTVSNCGHVAKETIELSCCHQKLLKIIKIVIIFLIKYASEIYTYRRHVA